MEREDVKAILRDVLESAERAEVEPGDMTFRVEGDYLAALCRCWLAVDGAQSRDVGEAYNQTPDELPQEGYTLRLRLALEHIARVGKASSNPSNRLTWIIDRAISAINDDHSWKQTKKPKHYHDALHQYHRADDA